MNELGPDAIRKGLLAMGVPAERIQTIPGLVHVAERRQPKPKADPSDYPLRVMRAWCRANGLPMPEAEYRFDPRRKWRFDWAWVAPKIALEVEGMDHRRTQRYEADLEKYSEACILGWCLLRCKPSRLFTDQTADLVRRAHARVR